MGVENLTLEMLTNRGYLVPMEKQLKESRLWLLIVLFGIIIFSGCATYTSSTNSRTVHNGNDSTKSSVAGIIKKCGTANAPIVNVYASPEYSIDVITKIDNGAVVTVTGRNSDSKFVLISLYGEKGWISVCDIVSEQDLSLIPVISYTGSAWASSTISSAAGIIKKCGTANAPIVNVYATPIFSIDVIAKIDNGAVVTVTGRNSDSKFVLISLNREKGWISVCDIVSEQDLSFLPVVSYSGSAWASYASSGSYNDPSSSGSSTTSGNSYSSTQASSYVGQVVTVKINHAYCSYQAASTGSPTFCNDGPYPNHNFTMVAFGRDLSYLDGNCILVTGEVELYRGLPEIEVNGTWQIEDCN